jgi:predicted transcriptional regulator
MSKDLLPMVADIVSAQTSQTPTPCEELTEAIRLVYTTLSMATMLKAPLKLAVSHSYPRRTKNQQWQSRSPSSRITSSAWKTAKS